MTLERCASCGAAAPRPFYEVSGVPTNSVRLMETEAEALGWPRGDLVLGHCAACGFVSNLAFEPRLTEYSPRYEETQGFSPTFNAFAERLVQRLVERWGVRGKTVLEIGCGKGEFLVRLCEAGENRGIGIDPSFRPERVGAAERRRIEFVAGSFPQERGSRPADVVCCRHTLEHVQPVRQFVEDVHASLGGRRDVLVLFELPETLRVLAEGAFWDVYYEHCSYFTPGSLARLFRASGFEVADLWLDFEDQYVLLLARPAGARTGASLPREDDLAAIAAGVERFRREGPARARAWRQRIVAAAAAGRRVVLWGSGSKAVAFLTTLGLRDEVAALVDINPHKQGRFLPGTGQRVLAPEALVEVDPHEVIVMNPVYRDEVAAHLLRLGLRPELGVV